MARTDLNEGLTSLDAESLRSFSESLPDEYHEWVSESGRSSRWVGHFGKNQLQYLGF